MSMVSAASMSSAVVFFGSADCVAPVVGSIAFFGSLIFRAAKNSATAIARQGTAGIPGVIARTVTLPAVNSTDC